jgi:cell division septation protein DedD
MKKRILFALLAVAAAQALLLSAGCASAAKSGASAAAEPRPEAVDPRERYTAEGGGQTFLDTLNRGREVTVSANDLPVLEVVPAVNFSSEKIAAAAEPRFRIQILASSQIDMARREKVNAENVMKQPVFMASEQSLYKLYVGDFKTRAEAEAALPEVRKQGYKDAWVVNAKVTQSP